MFSHASVYTTKRPEKKKDSQEKKKLVKLSPRPLHLAQAKDTPEEKVSHQSTKKITIRPKRQMIDSRELMARGEREEGKRGERRRDDSLFTLGIFDFSFARCVGIF
ncbi:hypothetical protein EVAR_20196_1 [Eumeta japonica]|uniref:Uncharacterized protein n=1 Tax=Eumeta variegata TaxID=151549 RepID=A0A4C1UV24_EUMVA|nr:hypothetical protein EVAR_20196_1 [Eumeta japonica]